MSARPVASDAPDDTDSAGLDFLALAWTRGGHLEPPAAIENGEARNLWRMTEGATRAAQTMLDPRRGDAYAGTPNLTSEALAPIVAAALVLGEPLRHYQVGSATDALELAERIVAEGVRRLERDAMIGGEPNGHDKEQQQSHPIATGGSFPVITAKEALSMPEVPIRVEGISLPRRGRCALVGPSGSGKGLVAEDLALSITRGRLFRGQFQVEPCPVAIIVAEGWAGIPGRQRAVYALHGIDAEEDVPLFYIPAAPAIDDPRIAEQLAQTLIDITPRPGLLITDTYRATFSGDENSSAEVSNYIRGLDLLVDAIDGAALTIAHTPWSGERERGSTAFRAAMDWVGLIAKEDDTITMSCLKAKDGPEFPPLRWRIEPRADSAAIVPIGDHEPERLAPLVWSDLPRAAQKFLQALAGQFSDEGATATQLQRVSGVPESSFFRTSKVVREWDLVDKSGHRLRLTTRGRGILP